MVAQWDLDLRSIVRYADVASGNEGITMIVRITGGKDAHVEVPMLVFINGKCSYPIQGVPDSVPGACFRSGKRGWMDKEGIFGMAI